MINTGKGKKKKTRQNSFHLLTLDKMHSRYSRKKIACTFASLE
jgi:hypothetical protein